MQQYRIVELFGMYKERGRLMMYADRQRGRV